MDDHLTKTLSRFGLSEPEIAIYLAALRLGKPTVSDLAKRTNLQRTLVYFHLKNLLKRDVIKELPSGKVKHFIATPPKELANRFERWVTDVYSIVPQLEALQTTDEQTPIITVQDFSTAHYEHYNELASMPEKSEFRVIQSLRSAGPDFQSFKPGQWKNVLQKMVDRKIMTRAIFTEELIGEAHKFMDSETYELFKQRNWQIRTVKADRFDFEEMMLHQDKVTFLLTDVATLVRIQHPRIAKAMTAMFDALWLTGTTKNFE